MDIKGQFKKPLNTCLQEIHDHVRQATQGPLYVGTHWQHYQPHTRLLGPQGEIVNWIMLATPYHPVLQQVINIMVDNILSGRWDEARRKRDVLRLTGPIHLTLVINEYRRHFPEQILITDILHDYVSYISFRCNGNCRSAYYSQGRAYDTLLHERILLPSRTTPAPPPSL